MFIATNLFYLEFIYILLKILADCFSVRNNFVHIWLNGAVLFCCAEQGGVGNVSVRDRLPEKTSDFCRKPPFAEVR